MKIDFYPSDRMPLSRALLWIFLYTLMISGIAWMVWLYYLHLREVRMQDNRYQITAIVQSTPQKESVRTAYLAELLNVSLDQPVNLYKFDTQEGIRQLLKSPVIKEASIKKIHPGTLYIDYTMRVPVAYVGDYSNTALDKDGYLFPFKPFFTPKNIPTIYLGLENLDSIWGQTINNDEILQLAFDVLSALQEKIGRENLFVRSIDVSQALADSYGQRQIVVLLEDRLDERYENSTISKIKPYYLRLNAEKYHQNLDNFLVLRKHLLNSKHQEFLSAKNQLMLKPFTIDLRISHLAFIKHVSAN